jgi:SET domain-containing protein
MYNKKNLKLKTTPRGKGVFTIGTISKNILIYEFDGKIFDSDTIDRTNPYIIQIGKNLYLGPSGDFDDYINHSCNPNCRVYIVGRRAFLYSLKDIPADTEITFDYSTTTNDDESLWSMNCNCKSYNCRKIIKGYQYLPEDIKQKYLKLNMIPKYLI